MEPPRRARTRPRSAPALRAVLPRALLAALADALAELSVRSRRLAEGNVRGRRPSQRDRTIPPTATGFEHSPPCRRRPARKRTCARGDRVALRPRRGRGTDN